MTVSTYRELLLGCGHSREKRLSAPGTPPEFKNLLTLDFNEACRPDFVCDLNILPWRMLHASKAADEAKVTRPSEYGPGSAFVSDSFGEIHAYEVLEHLHILGDFRGFLADMSEAWRVLKPGGYFIGTCPSRFSGWLWGDPGHTRAILPETMTFLDQGEYIRQLDNGRPTSMSDYRNVYRADFKTVQQATNRDTFYFILQAVKPSRWVDSLAR